MSLVYYVLAQTKNILKVYFCVSVQLVLLDGLPTESNLIRWVFRFRIYDNFS